MRLGADDRPPAALSRPLDRSRYAAPQVFERLRELIVALELVPGTALSRQDLADRFGLSQTPIRDALMRLAGEGLVDVFPQHATVVSRIDLSAARQAHYLRRAIELEVVRSLAQQRDRTLVARLRDRVAQQQRLAAEADYAAFTDADRAFHRELYVAAAVPDLWHLVRGSSGNIDRLRRLHLLAAGKVQAVVADHARIVDAIDRGDDALAQQRVREHLSDTLGMVEDIRRRYPDYVKD